MEWEAFLLALSFRFKLEIKTHCIAFIGLPTKEDINSFFQALRHSSQCIGPSTLKTWTFGSSPHAMKEFHTGDRGCGKFWMIFHSNREWFQESIQRIWLKHSVFKRRNHLSKCAQPLSPVWNSFIVSTGLKVSHGPHGQCCPRVDASHGRPNIPTTQLSLQLTQNPSIYVARNSFLFQGVNGTAQPGASNMYKLKWSDELERIAQRLADQCTWFHSDNDVLSMRISLEYCAPLSLTLFRKHQPTPPG